MAENMEYNSNIRKERSEGDSIKYTYTYFMARFNSIRSDKHNRDSSRIRFKIRPGDC